MKKTYKLENLGCASCAARMETAIASLDGVNSASISYMSQKLFLDVKDEKFESVIEAAVKACKRIEPDCTILV